MLRRALMMLRVWKEMLTMCGCDAENVECVP